MCCFKRSPQSRRPTSPITVSYLVAYNIYNGEHVRSGITLQWIDFRFSIYIWKCQSLIDEPHQDGFIYHVGDKKQTMDRRRGSTSCNIVTVRIPPPSTMVTMAVLISMEHRVTWSPHLTLPGPSGLLLLCCDHDCHGSRHRPGEINKALATAGVMPWKRAAD